MPSSDKTVNETFLTQTRTEHFQRCFEFFSIICFFRVIAIMKNTFINENIETETLVSFLAPFTCLSTAERFN